MRHMRRVKRATVGVSTLGWVAAFCIFITMCFWLFVMFDLLQPPQFVSAQTAQMLLTTAAFGLVLPLFFSMLFPSSPAGKLLLQQSWATPGYIAVAVAAVFLTYVEWVWISTWWSAQPQIANIGQVYTLSIASLIVSVLVPGISWTVVTPEQWLAQIEQARMVKHIEHQLKLEEIYHHAHQLRAANLLAAGIAELVTEERQELAAIFGTSYKRALQSQKRIAETFWELHRLELLSPTHGDEGIIDDVKTIATVLTEAEDDMSSTAQRIATPPFTERPTEQRVHVTPQHTEQTALQSQSEHRTNDRTTERQVNERTAMDRSGSVTERTDDRTNDRIYQIARDHLSGLWTSNDLQKVLSLKRTMASTYIARWREAGLLDISETHRNHYFWTTN